MNFKEFINSEAVKRISQLKALRFELKMKDGWTPADFAQDDKYLDEIREINELLANING